LSRENINVIFTLSATDNNCVIITLIQYDYHVEIITMDFENFRIKSIQSTRSVDQTRVYIITTFIVILYDMILYDIIFLHNMPILHFLNDNLLRLIYII